MGKQFSNFSSQYGAPMGRPTTGDAPRDKVSLFRVTMIDGAYDDGGAYWGMGMPLFCARGEAVNGDEFQRFVRAGSRAKAAEALGLSHAQLLRPISARDRKD
jgi:hypothetical protein